MRTFVTFLLIGLSVGSIYAVAALGLVLTFKTSGIFNFAQGALGAVGAGIFYELRTRDGVPWPIALVLAVAGCGGLLGIVLERIARELATRSIASQIAATVGVLISLQAGVLVIFGTSPLTFPAYLPTASLHVAGVFVGADRIITAGVALAVLVTLTVFLRGTRTGLAMSAVVRDPELLDVTGIDPIGVRRLAWVLGTSLAALSGVLLAPSIGFNATTLTLLVVQAFGGAAIGSFSSLPLTYLGSLGLGIATALIQRYTVDVASLRGLPPSLPFVILFIVLSATPRRRLAASTLGAARSVSGTQITVTGAARVRRRAGLAAIITFLAIAPAFAGTRLPVYSEALVYVLIFMALAVLIRLSGQVSLSVLSFAAIGATTFSHAQNDAHLPWLLALIVAGMAAVPVGALIAIPAIRLPGVYLALASLGFGILLEQLVYPTSLMFGGKDRLPTRRPAVLGFDTDRGYYYLLLGAALVAAVAVVRIQTTRLGRLLRGMSDSPLALTTSGLSVGVTRLLVFAASSFLAAVAGALYGPITGGVTGGVASPFTALTSLSILAILFVAGRDVVLASFIGAMFFVLPTYARSDTLTNYYPIVFGVLVIAAALRSSGPRRPVRPAIDRPSPHSRLGRGPAKSRSQTRPLGATSPAARTGERPPRRSTRCRGAVRRPLAYPPTDPTPQKGVS
ncbi:MAG TPA: ABC transporter permease [Mycobacteriales bacterium]|nr:ABC transporter permease [Mycobacteriales bacterium]